MRLGIGLVAPLLAFLSMGLAQLEAQEASPEATPSTTISTGATPEVLDPTLCAVEPRTVENLQQLLSTSAAGNATPQASPAALETPFVLPQGSSPDADAIDGVTDTVREAIACLNAGDMPRYLALHTDDYVASLAGQEPPSQTLLGDLSAPPAPLDPGAQVGLISIEDIRMLADGRIAVLIRQNNPSGPTGGPERVFFVLTEQRGRYLIDEEIVPHNPNDRTATPAA